LSFLRLESKDAANKKPTYIIELDAIFDLLFFRREVEYR